MQIEQTDNARPWWKEPWPWLLMSGPLVAMAGCAVTIWLAMQNADTPIVDGVQRRGLVIEQSAGGPGARPTVAAGNQTAGRP